MCNCQGWNKFNIDSPYAIINNWVHFVISYSSSNEQKTYINGELVSIDNVLGTIDYCPGGRYQLGWNILDEHGFQGKLDDVGLWIESSQAEVAQLYNGIIDTVSPTVTLSHNASPTTTVSNGDSVTVTATFSEAMQATPTINISGGKLHM